MAPAPVVLSALPGFRAFSTEVAYVLYEIKCEEADRPIAVRHLSTANRCKNLFKESEKVCYVGKRIGFLDNGCIYCTNGNTHVVDVVIENEERVCNATTAFDILEAFGL